MLRDQILDMMKKLELYGMIEKYDKIMNKAHESNMPNEEIFMTLIDTELAYRKKNKIDNNLK